MSKEDEYRAQAEECERMAGKAWNDGDKATWLKMAQDWLRMIRRPDRSASDKFDDAEKVRVTGQTRSNAEH